MKLSKPQPQLRNEHNLRVPTTPWVSGSFVINFCNFSVRVEDTGGFQTETLALLNWDFHGWQCKVIVMERGGFGLPSLVTAAGNITATGNFSLRPRYFGLNFSASVTHDSFSCLSASCSSFVSAGQLERSDRFPKVMNRLVSLLS